MGGEHGTGQMTQHESAGLDLPRGRGGHGRTVLWPREWLQLLGCKVLWEEKRALGEIGG